MQPLKNNRGSFGADSNEQNLGTTALNLSGSLFKNDSTLYRMVNGCVNFKDVFALKNISLSISVVISFLLLAHQEQVKQLFSTCSVVISH